jgi:hypothetical protein
MVRRPPPPYNILSHQLYGGGSAKPTSVGAEAVEALKLSLGMIRERAAPLKDDLLSYLLDMVILHLSRKFKTKTIFRGNKTSGRGVSGKRADSSDFQSCQFEEDETAPGDAPEIPSAIVSRSLWRSR